MLWSYLIKGGYLMIPIGLSSIIALAVFLERYLFLKKVENSNSFLLSEINPLVSKNDFEKIDHICDQSQDLLSSRIIKSLIINSKLNKTEAKSILNEEIDREFHKIESKIPILGTIASVAPLLGLLGTVLGMIDALQSMETNLQLSNLKGGTDFLHGIWTALITTAAGLFVAIPSLTAYNYLVNKANYFMSNITNQLNTIADLIFLDKN